MNSIRIMRIGIKEVLIMTEQMANSHRHTITENWDKERTDKEARKALYKAHRGLAKCRKVIRECQMQMKATKLELRKLNHQYDIGRNAIALKEAAERPINLL